MYEYVADGPRERERSPRLTRCQAVGWCALPFPQYALPDDDDRGDGARRSGSRVPGHGEARVQVNFWFFLFVYYGCYSVTALIWITKVFNLYSLNWYVSSLCPPSCYFPLAAPPLPSRRLTARCCANPQVARVSRLPRDDLLHRRRVGGGADSHIPRAGEPVPDRAQHGLDYVDVRHHGRAGGHRLLHPHDQRAPPGPAPLAVRDAAHLHVVVVDRRARHHGAAGRPPPRRPAPRGAAGRGRGAAAARVGGGGLRRRRRLNHGARGARRHAPPLAAGQLRALRVVLPRAVRRPAGLRAGRGLRRDLPAHAAAQQPRDHRLRLRLDRDRLPPRRPDRLDPGR